MTTLSLNFRQAAYAHQTGRVLIVLFTLDHTDWASSVRLSSDQTQELTGLTTDLEKVYGTVSNGDTFIYLPMRIQLPDDTSDGPGNIVLEMDNIHKSLIEELRAINSPVTCNTQIVLDNALNTVERSWPEFLLTDIRYDQFTIRSTLMVETLENEPFPYIKFTPSTAPGLYS